jgi:hypothetical protein
MNFITFGDDAVEAVQEGIGKEVPFAYAIVLVLTSWSVKWGSGYLAAGKMSCE